MGKCCSKEKQGVEEEGEKQRMYEVGEKEMEGRKQQLSQHRVGTR